jgi:hypothetical protein
MLIPAWAQASSLSPPGAADDPADDFISGPDGRNSARFKVVAKVRKRSISVKDHEENSTPQALLITGLYLWKRYKNVMYLQ